MPADGSAATARASLSDREAREIIRKYDKLIRKLANRSARYVRLSSHDADDFYATGMEAACKAVLCFDPDRGVVEAAWVARLVRQAIEREAAVARAQGLRHGVPTAMIPMVDDYPEVSEEPAVEQKQLRWLVEKIEQKLLPSERNALVGFLSDASSVHAHERGVSKQRIEQLKSRAIEKLRRSARLTFRVA